MVLIRPLTEGDLTAYAALRRRSLDEQPLAFAASPETDVVVQIGKAPDWMLFGAFDGEMAGAAGLIRPRHPKAAHKMHLWGMYVHPTFRRQGIAALLLQAAIDHARSTPGVEWVQLGVTEDAAEARRVYARAGFETWGVEPDALRFGGRSVGRSIWRYAFGSAIMTLRPSWKNAVRMLVAGRRYQNHADADPSSLGHVPHRAVRRCADA